MAGDVTWPAGHAVMDSPQVHIYRDLLLDKSDAKSPAKVIHSAQVIADYTSNIWLSHEKPNWIGEFGVINHPVIKQKMFILKFFIIHFGRH